MKLAAPPKVSFFWGGDGHGVLKFSLQSTTPTPRGDLVHCDGSPVAAVAVGALRGSGG